MNARHRKTLEDVFAEPTLSNIAWNRIESLLKALGAEITEGSGSRIRVYLNKVRAVFHRPHPEHPEKETDKGALKSVRRFLKEGGIRP